jgi:hypothetical protein
LKDKCHYMTWVQNIKPKLFRVKVNILLKIKINVGYKDIASKYWGFVQQYKISMEYSFKNPFGGIFDKHLE